MHTTKFIFRVAISILLFIVFQTSFAQENYLPGYILSLRGDTLHGYIDYRNWERTPDKIFFKEKESDLKSTYAPLDIRGFGVLDEVYESAVIETETSPVKTDELKYNPELVIRMDTGFLQAVVKGIKSLYYFKNMLGNEQFYIRKDSSFELLVHKKYLKDQDGHSVIIENKKFIGQLTIYLGDCPTIQQKLKGTDYQKNSLEKLFLAYYSCTKSEIKFHKKTEKLTNEFGIIAGASLTSLTFRSNDFPSLVYGGYNKSVNFSGGLFYDLILSRNNRKWSICNELIYSGYEVNGRYEEYVNEHKYTVMYTTFGYSYLKMNNMLRFKYPVGKCFIYLNAGISNGYAIVEKNYLKQESTLYTQVLVGEAEAIPNARRWELGILAGLGMKFKRYSFEARYETANGMSSFPSLTSATNRLYLFLGFRF